MKKIKATTLFSNIGIDEYYLNDVGVEVVLANELDKNRATVYRHLYPKSTMINADITDKITFSHLIELHLQLKSTLLIATPPCQGFSKLSSVKDKTNDPRNSLILYVLDFISKTLPENFILENVADMQKYNIILRGKEVKVVEHIIKVLESLHYKVWYGVYDSANYGVPQSRKRFILRASRIGDWLEPQKSKTIKTVRDAIGDLPSLEAGEDSGIKYHTASAINEMYINFMKHTPSGKSAHDNPDPYKPRNEERELKRYASSYSRQYWDTPSTTITQRNNLPSRNRTFHPGRLKEDGTYSDTRTLTLLEVLRLFGLPDTITFPSSATEQIIRDSLGEALPPHFLNAFIETMPRDKKSILDKFKFWK